MKSWPTMRVEEVCNLVRGSSPRPKSDPRYYGGPIPRLTIADITRDGWLVTPRLDSLTELGATMSRPVKAGTIVMAVSGNVGLCAELAVDACIHDGFVAFKDLRKDLFMPSFFGLAMGQMGETHERNKAGAIFQNITTSDVKAMPIPMPPLAEQERIVNLLDEADELRKLRAKADQRATTLIPALFHEMFGDPATNPKGLPIVQLVEVTSPKQWPTISQQQLTDKGFPVYGANGRIGFYSEFNHEASTVLITCRGATCGTINVCEPKSYVTGNAMALDEPKTALLNITFLEWILRVRGLNDTITGSAQPQITRQSLGKVSFPVPPLTLQKEFAQRVTEIREFEAGQVTSLTRMDALFQSMLHRAFNGEL